MRGRRGGRLLLHPYVVGLLAAWIIAFASGQCHKNCHGHGSCSLEGKCTCYQGFTGPDCSLIECPEGLAWSVESSVPLIRAHRWSNVSSCEQQVMTVVCLMCRADIPYTTDKAHQMAGCSNMGICNYEKGGRYHISISVSQPLVV